MAEYAHPEVLVSTEWVDRHGNDPKVRLVEVDVDRAAYDEGHVPGAIAWAWSTQLCDTVRRDILPQNHFEELMASSGISRDTAVVLYGDNNNWFAAWAFWQLKIYGHPDVRLMDGGRKKWLAEGRELTRETPRLETLRAFLRQVQEAQERGSAALVDVRSPQEFTGEILAPPGLLETAQRGGHIPGAANIPWGQAVKEDGTFKSVEDLKALYGGKGVTPDKDVIAYCRIGERSSHTWFVLKHLLDYGNVKNYDGSWTEWGSMVGNPVEKP
jgi:thiosulfate/3-mercaptopyruvate sulfurtransferase